MNVMPTACYNSTLPITPALSLRERVNPSASLAMTGVGEMLGDGLAIQTGQALFPLPAGEGQGEGQGSKQTVSVEYL